MIVTLKWYNDYPLCHRIKVTVNVRLKRSANLPVQHNINNIKIGTLDG